MAFGPLVRAKRKILVVGDSVAFGVGVKDGETFSSHLQELMGNARKVVNAGVGGYDGFQAFQIADELSNAITMRRSFTSPARMIFIPTTSMRSTA
jgi:hypothetical protein